MKKKLLISALAAVLMVLPRVFQRRGDGGTVTETTTV